MAPLVSSLGSGFPLAYLMAVELEMDQLGKIAAARMRSGLSTFLVSWASVLPPFALAFYKEKLELMLRPLVLGVCPFLISGLFSILFSC